MTPDERITALWHPTMNGALTPADISRHSHKKVWWRCPEGHDWETMVYTIAAGTGCPYCSGKQVLPGFNDLATTHPDLAVEWDIEHNGDFRPDAVTHGSIKEAWWRCPEGHIYQAKVFSRVAGTDCPYCSGKKVLAGYNDLMTTAPAIAAQWCEPLNDGLLPTGFTRGSHKKVWWQCSEGHVWQAAIYARTRSNASNCPICAGKARRRPKSHAGQSAKRGIAAYPYS